MYYRSYKEWWIETFQDIKDEHPDWTDEQIEKEMDNAWGDLVDMVHETHKDDPRLDTETIAKTQEEK